MRSFWNNQKDTIWNYGGVYFHEVRGQTYWLFHLKTDNLEDLHAKNTNTRSSVSIHSMHFVFPFCQIRVGFIIIPISKKSWEVEETLFSDFSLTLPLRVNSRLWDFYNTKFTLRNLIPRSSARRRGLIDRGLAEFIFPNTTLIDKDTNTCFCCRVSLNYNSSLGGIE